MIRSDTNGRQNMNTADATLKTTRLVLSGALLGVAIVGLFSHVMIYDVIGAMVGGAAVLAAKAKHFI